MRRPVLVLVFHLLLGCLIGASSAWCQAYTSIVVFGDSLSDTGNDAALSRAKYTFSAQVPGPATGYTDGRFTDGTDTVPAARNYNGVWIEQLAAKLASRPTVKNSLSGGTNYAYGFATTAGGTTQFTYGPGNALSFTVENMGQQITDYLATSPTVNSSTLFVVWGGANDLLNATSTADIVTAASREVALVRQLIAAGATDIIVPNLPPLGLVPRLNGSAASSAAANAAAQGFNQALAAGLAQVAAANTGRPLHLFPIDIYTLFSTLVASPAANGFTNVTAASQGNATVNPDTYLFWDDLHPTTYGHSLVASAALRLVSGGVTTSTSLASSASNVNLNGSVTLTATVSASSGTPVGTVTFLDGTTAIGSSLVTGSGTTATAALTTSTLTAGSHTLTASFAGVNGFGSSASSASTVTVVPPTYAVAASPASLTIARGSSGTSTISITPAGGYTGSFAVMCGSVSRITCSVGLISGTITGTAAASALVTIGTANAATLVRPVLHEATSLHVELALVGLPALILLGLCKGKQGPRAFPRLMLFLLLSSAGLLGVSGCGDSHGHDTPAGTYQVPVTVTPASGTATTVNIAVTVQ